MHHLIYHCEESVIYFNYWMLKKRGKEVMRKPLINNGTIPYIGADGSFIAAMIGVAVILKAHFKGEVYIFMGIGILVAYVGLCIILYLSYEDSKIVRQVIKQVVITLIAESIFTLFPHLNEYISIAILLLVFKMLIKLNNQIIKIDREQYETHFSLFCLLNLSSIILSFIETNINLKNIRTIGLIIIYIIYFMYIQFYILNKKMKETIKKVITIKPKRDISIMLVTFVMISALLVYYQKQSIIINVVDLLVESIIIGFIIIYGFLFLFEKSKEIKGHELIDDTTRLLSLIMFLYLINYQYKYDFSIYIFLFILLAVEYCKKNR